MNRSIVGSAALILTLMALSAPLLLHAYPFAAAVLYAAFAKVCQQQGARSYWIAGAPVAVCVRCLGAYCGGVVGAFVRVPNRILEMMDGGHRSQRSEGWERRAFGTWRFFLAAIAMNLMEWGLEIGFGAFPFSVEIRYLTGVLLGLSAVALVVDSGRFRNAPQLRLQPRGEARSSR